MRLLKVLFSICIAAGLILLGYYFVWNFMASKRTVHIKQILENSKIVNFSYKDFVLTGYPENININVEDLKLVSKNTSSRIRFEIGDVLFKIYPFVLEQQANIILPRHQTIFLEGEKGTHEYKLDAKNIDFIYLNNEYNVEFANLKLYSVTNNKLLLQAEKVYYTAFEHNANRLKINMSDIVFGNGEKIDSAFIDLEMSDLEQLDILTFALSNLTLKGTDLNNYVSKMVDYFSEHNSKITIKNTKVVTKDSWFSLDAKLNLDKRKRFSGKIDLVGDKISTVEDILKFMTANRRINLEKISVIQRLIEQSRDNVVRISGKLERGFLYIFNEKMVRIKEFTKNFAQR